MSFKPISYNNKTLTIHKATSNPLFNEKTVLVQSTWNYVDLWLKRNGYDSARFFWNQAKSFYDATLTLPVTSSPLTAYYCFLNASKALLISKNVNFGGSHGVSGFTVGNQTSLSNEKVKFQRQGILSALCQLLNESSNGEVYSLKDLLYNLPGIHRAFDLSYTSTPELFIPIHNPVIVRKSRSNEAWFCAEIKGKYANGHTLRKLPGRFEKENGVHDQFIIRSKDRFRWKSNDNDNNIQRYRSYHKKIRKSLFSVRGVSRLWYLKRRSDINGVIDRSSITLMFSAMHKLSEMSRYHPDKLSRHFECQHNWLLSEFIESAAHQFIDEISSELTGNEFLVTGIRT